MRGRIHADAAAYGLGVLDDPRGFEAHLAGCARCRDRVARFRELAGDLELAARLGYLPPGDGAPGRHPWLPGPRAGRRLLVTLCVTVTALCAASPAAGSGRLASAACIVSPAHVVTGSDAVPRDLPGQAGFQ